MRFAHALLLTATLAVPATTLHAQAQTAGTRFGVEAAFANHFSVGIGAFVKFHLADLSGHPLTGRAAFDYYFPGDFDACGNDTFCTNPSQHFWQLSADALYDIANPKSDLKPYVGAGAVYSDATIADCTGAFCPGGGLGLDILGGLNFMANSKLMPFVEVKLGIGGVSDAFGYGGSEFVLKGGIHF